MHDPSAVTTFLFTDIEGSSRLWEQVPERMRLALARHDILTREAVSSHGGVVVKMIGDGVHAAFDDPLQALAAAIRLQKSLEVATAELGVPLRVRCGLHSGVFEQRDNDFFGPAVNRAARIMSAAHGGQVLLSQTVAALLAGRLPPDVKLHDLGLLRLRDLAQPEHIHQVVHPDLRREFPALRSLQAPPNNLPQQLTAFVGRARELAEARDLLRRMRMLTLVGTGGLGKTRLSLQLGAELAGEYADGVWFVELAPLQDPRRVAQAVATVLGVTEEPGRPVTEALLKFVADRELLVVLDNCEHLLRACAELSRLLLQSGRRLRILASSREAMHVSGEVTYPLAALGFPEPHAVVSPDALLEFEAVRLFVDRAAAALPSFRVTSGNASVIAGICHHLDGIPLAIELAAAHVRTLPIEEIFSRLGDRFRLLRRGDPTLLPRQQTLRASIDWSYELLTPTERSLLERLAVFAGGWTLESAEAVGAEGAIASDDVLDLLHNLVEKSLVETELEHRRYRLLETVRQYAGERLAESGDGDRTRVRHLTHYVALAEEASRHLIGPDQAEWLARLDAERENLLSAHAFCDRAEAGAELGLSLAHSVKMYWVNRGLLGLGHRVTVEALARSGAQERTLARCRALFNAGQTCCFMGRYAEAEGYLAESLAIARELGDLRRVAMVLQLLGMASIGMERRTAARGHLQEALELVGELGDMRELAAATNGISQLDRMEGDFERATGGYERVVTLARELGDGEIVAIGLLNLAMVAVGRESCDRARALIVEVLDIAERIGSQPAGQSALEVSAGLASVSREWDRAARFFGMAEGQADRAGLHRDPADEAFLTPLVERARDALGTPRFDDMTSGGRGVRYEDAIAEARRWLVRRGSDDEAAPAARSAVRNAPQFW